MKNQAFRVELTFSDKIYSDKELMEIANKVAISIQRQIESSDEGIAPEDSEAHTEIIRVTPWYLNTTIIIHP